MPRRDYPAKVDRFACAILSPKGKKTGRKWRVCLIEAGWSKNRGRMGQRYFPPETLKEAIALFEGAPVCEYGFNTSHGEDRNHLPEGIRAMPQVAGGLTHNVVGRLSEVSYDAFERPGGAASEGLCADLTLYECAERLAGILVESWDAGVTDLLGLSIDSQGSARAAVVEGRQAEYVGELSTVHSVDVVTNPAAGGGFLRLVASVQNENGQTTRSAPMWKKLLAFIESMGAHWTEGFDAPADEGGLRDFVVSVLEANRSRAVEEAAGLTDEGAIRASLRGISVINGAITAAKEDKPNEAEAALAPLAAVVRESVDANKYDMPETPETPATPATPASPTTPAEPAAPATPTDPAAPAEASAVAESVAALTAQMDALVSRSDTAIRAMEATNAASRAAHVATRISESGLPETARDALTEELAGDPTDDMVNAAIARTQRVAESLASSAAEPIVLGQGPRITLGDSPRDKVQMMMDLAFTPELAHDEETREAYRGLTPLGLRESYVLFHGTPHFGPTPDSAIYQDNIPMSFRETVSTGSWTNAFGISMTRRLVRDYRLAGFDWKRLAVQRTDIKDFREQTRVRVFNYGDFSVVPEGSDYPAMSDPSDEAATYTPTKRGGLVTVTWEAILADDLGAISRRIKGLGRAMNRTVSQHVIDQVLSYGSAINDTAIYDSVVLYHSGSHANTATGALSYATLMTAIRAMYNQTDDGSSEVLGIRPKTLLVPIELEDTAMQLLGATQYPNASTASTVPNTIRRYLGPDDIMVSSQLRSDTNNWYLVADPAEYETVEVGFVGGQTEPVLEAQDQPTLGTVFTADSLRYKTRLAWGAAVLDYRNFYGGIVG